MILFLDSETCDLPDFKRPAEDPSQPHIVQLGAILYNQERRVVSEINLLVRPEGWKIAPEAEAVHGISFEMAANYGLPLNKVMEIFSALADRAELLVAHNYDFDNKMLRREYHHLNLGGFAESLRHRKSYCTMKAATPIVNIPPTERMLAAGFNKPKSASMSEAYWFFTGKEMDCAHDAMEDVRACAAVYFAMNPVLVAPATEGDAL